MLLGDILSYTQGYITCGVVLHDGHALVPQVIPSFKSDLESGHDMPVCMALAVASNIGGKNLAEALGPIASKLIGYIFFQVTRSNQYPEIHHQWLQRRL